MNKKEYLQQYKYLDKRINRQLEEIQELRSLAEKITPSYSDMPKSHNGQDKIQSAVEKIILLEQELDKLIDKYIDLRREIELKINSIDDKRLQDLLKYRYIDGLTFEAIAIEMNYSYMQICRLHGQALNKIML